MNSNFFFKKKEFEIGDKWNCIYICNILCFESTSKLRIWNWLLILFAYIIKIKKRERERERALHEMDVSKM